MVSLKKRYKSRFFSEVYQFTIPNKEPFVKETVVTKSERTQLLK